MNRRTSGIALRLNTAGKGHHCRDSAGSSMAMMSASSDSCSSHHPRRRRRRLPSSLHPLSPQSPAVFIEPRSMKRVLPSQQNRAQQRHYASPSNDFWRDLNDAVQDGDAFQAEEKVKALVLASEDANDVAEGSRRSRRQPIDTKLFSMVLQALKNHNNKLKNVQKASSKTGLRASNLVEQMKSLADSGVLTTPPTLDDYHTVLECWIEQTSPSRPFDPVVTDAHASSVDGDESNSTSQQIQKLLSQVSDPSTQTIELALKVLSNEGNSGDILQIIRDLRKRALERKLKKGPPIIHPTLNMYNSLIKAYAIKETPDQAMLLLEKMQDQSFKDSERSAMPLPSPDVETYNLLIAYYCAKPHPERLKQAEALLDQMRDEKVQRSASSYLPAITGLSKLAEAKRAENLLARMIQDYQMQFDADLKPTLAPFRSVLWGYSKSYHPEAAQDAESLLNNMFELNKKNVLDERPSIWSFNLVLKCWAKSKDPKAPRKAKQLYERMSTHDIVPDSTSMNTVLNTWAKKANPINTEKLFWEFYNSYIQDPLENPQPNIISFGTVLNALASKASRYTEAPDRAEALFRKLFELHQAGWEGCRPDAPAFSSLMQCWGKSKQPGGAEKAESILRKMQELAREGGDPDMVPDTICWNAAIQAWALAGNGERAEALFREMLATYIRDENDRHKPNIITFTAVLSAWAKTRFNRQAPKRAESLLEQMEKLHQSGALDVKPNYVSYSIVLDCLAYAKKQSATERAEMLLDHMRKSSDRDLQPNVVSYNAVIKAWSFVKDPRAVSKATSLMDELIEKSQDNYRMTPNASTFGSVLKTIADSRETDKASRADAIVKLMEKYNIVMNDWSKNQLKRCYEGPSELKASLSTSKKIPMPRLPTLDYSS